MIPMVYASPTTFYFDPAMIVAPPPSIGGTFTVTIRVDAVPDLFMWVMDISWDPAAFDLVGDPVQGAAISTSGPTVFTWSSIADGFIDDLTCGSLFGAEVSVPPNPNDLCELTFMVEDFSFGTNIQIDWAIWITVGGLETTPDLVPLYFEYPPPPPTPPTASKMPPSGSVFYVDEIINFDASSSTPGYDGDDSCPITEYRWDFDGVPGWEVVDSVPTTTWFWSSPGAYMVTLEVYAPGIPPTIDPRYVETDTEIQTINIIPIPLGAALDIYTQRNGIGPDIPSDAFGPQEEVCIYGLVTYNLEPVVNKLVGFEVKDPFGEVRLTRTASTNEDGLAMVCFRIPWTGMDAEDLFGMWVIYGSADIAGEVATDTCPFEFGYLVSIMSVMTVDAMNMPKGEFLVGEELHIHLELSAIGMASKVVTIAVTVYDDAGVPIGHALIPGFTVPPGPSSFFNAGIPIPTWRFKGVGTVYVNLFTDTPQAGGVPYCPEASAIFTLG
jgi:hypothetical protein